MPTGNQLLLYYGFSHRSVKWWKWIFFHLFDLSLVNSHILFKTSTGSRMMLLDFRTSVAKSLIEGMENPCKPLVASAPELQAWITERAFSEPISDKCWANCKAFSDRGRHKWGIGASCAMHLCAYLPFTYTPVLSSTIHSKTIKSSIGITPSFTAVVKGA